MFAQTIIEKKLNLKLPEKLLNTNIAQNKSYKAHDHDHSDDKDRYIEICPNHKESGRWA